MLTKDYSSSSCLGVDLTILVRNANPTNSNEIKKILGYVSKSEVIHKDDMVKI